MVDTVLLIVVKLVKGGGRDWEKRAWEADGLADPGRTSLEWDSIHSQESLMSGQSTIL